MICYLNKFMIKKRFVTIYADGLEKKTRSSGSLFFIKTSGDSTNDVFDSNSNLNLKNTYVNKLNDINLNKNITTDFGNDFIINDLRTSNDQLHYDGINKFIELKLVYNSGSSINNTSFNLSGSNLFLTKSLYDTNNVLLVNGRTTLNTFGINTLSNFGFLSNSSHQLPVDVKLVMEISASNTIFTSSEFNIKFKDDSVTGVWGQYRDVTLLGNFMKISDNKYQFIYDFMFSSSFSYPSMSYVGNSLNLSLTSSSGKNYTFSNIALIFKEKLTNLGVKFYRELDNDNNDKIFSNIGFLGKKVE